MQNEQQIATLILALRRVPQSTHTRRALLELQLGDMPSIDLLRKCGVVVSDFGGSL